MHGNPVQGIAPGRVSVLFAHLSFTRVLFAHLLFAQVGAGGGRLPRTGQLA
ncbi:hypothetical protein M8Z33_11865 [Streptomyces sp. ZAF1911]|uniref:hypothetical protein n=1 Tax=Streptomyces sp. ZAF1911 TaxID=2944129 RepID=UPI00237A7700|nr:hypothetical protein [Streptomyces sp. ZAF1911]MDD9377349.1 hypothetical protein [Streptomyces sp. ZAF1911]